MQITKSDFGDDEPGNKTPVTHHFVEVMIGLICVVAISVSVAQHVFGLAAMLGGIGLILLARSFFGLRE